MYVMHIQNTENISQKQNMYSNKILSIITIHV